jgi:hypothetical protein
VCQGFQDFKNNANAGELALESKPSLWLTRARRRYFVFWLWKASQAKPLVWFGERGGGILYFGAEMLWHQKTASEVALRTVEFFAYCKNCSVL